MNRIKGTSFNRYRSVRWAKRLVWLFILIVSFSAWHELFTRQLIDDPQSATLHTWRVIRFTWPWLEYYRLTVNLINLLVSGFINLLATVFLLHKSTQMKEKFVKQQSTYGYWTLLRKQLPLYGSPLALVVLSLIRVSFSFTLVCITQQWQKYLYLGAYIVSFVPLMGTFPIFVLPAKIYKTEFNTCVQRMRRALTRTFI